MQTYWDRYCQSCRHTETDFVGHVDVLGQILSIIQIILGQIYCQSCKHTMTDVVSPAVCRHTGTDVVSHADSHTGTYIVSHADTLGQILLAVQSADILGEILSVMQTFWDRYFVMQTHYNRYCQPCSPKTYLSI